MQQNVLATISGRRVSAAELARQWLVKFAEVCQRDVTPELSALWAAHLGDLAPDALDRACNHLMKTWSVTFLPTPGAVRKQIEDAFAKGVQIEAEEEWSKALKVATEFFQPDIGLYRNAPKLSATTWHALRAAGGLEHLQSCTREELQWVRRRFIADYTLVQETRKVEHLLGDGEAKAVLARLTAGPPDVNQNVPASAPSSMREENLPPRAELRPIQERSADILDESEMRKK